MPELQDIDNFLYILKKLRRQKKTEQILFTAYARLSNDIPGCEGCSISIDNCPIGAIII